MTQTPQQLPKRWLVPFPEKKSHMHPCQIACDGNQKMGYLLYYFLYEASWERDRQNLEESCNVVVLTCKHEDILKKVNISEKTLIEFLKTFHEWGFVLNERYSKNYIVQADPIREAMYNPKSCSKKVNFTTLMTLEECCKVEAMLKQLQEVQLYNIALETKLEAALQRIEDLEIKSCKVEANPEEGKLYNFSEDWIQAVSDALGIELPTRTIEKNLTKETIRDSFVETSDDVSDPNTEPDYFERETICPECGNLTADPQSCLHNFPIGSTTQGEDDGTSISHSVHPGNSQSHLPSLDLPEIGGYPNGTTQSEQQERHALDPVSVTEVATGNSTTKESEHRANANTLHHPLDTLLPDVPAARTGGLVSGQSSRSGTAQEREGGVDHVPAPATTPGLPSASDTLDLPPGQTEPTLQQMEMEQEAHDTVTTLEQNTPKPAESPLAVGVALTSASGIQQVSTQCHLISPSPSSTPGRRSASLSDTPVTADAAQARQEKPRRTRKAPTPKPAKPKFELTEQQQHFWQLWCTTWFNEGSPIQLTETAYGHVKILAPFVTTPEQVDSLTKRARRDLQEMTGVQKKSVQLGNLVYSLPGWRQEQRPDEQRDEQKPPAHPQPVLPLEAVKAARLARESHAVLQA